MAKPRSTSTMTALGLVKHLSVPVRGKRGRPSIMLAPVKLDYSRPHHDGLYLPMIRRGQFVHALPGGREWLGESL